MNKESVIYLDNVNKSYGKKQILKDVSLSVEEGTIFGLLGPSGCGKTTTVRIIAGILKKDCGDVKILGKEMPDLKLMSKIGYMAQSAALYTTLSAYDNLKFFGKLYGLKKDKLEERIKYVCEITDLSDNIKQKVSTFSGGMKQRLSLAIALIGNPKILILDEPTVGIDPVLRKNIWNELYKLTKKGVTILITTHVMDEAEKCDRLAMMRDGKILAIGTCDEIKKEAKVNTVEDAFIYFGKQGE